MVERSHSDHEDGKQFRIKKIFAEKGLICIETTMGKLTKHSIKEFVTRLDSIAKANHRNQLKEEDIIMRKLTSMGMKAISDAYTQLGKANLPESVKLYLATEK